MEPSRPRGQWKRRGGLLALGLLVGVQMLRYSDLQTIAVLPYEVAGIARVGAERSAVERGLASYGYVTRPQGPRTLLVEPKLWLSPWSFRRYGATVEFDGERRVRAVALFGLRGAL